MPVIHLTEIEGEAREILAAAARLEREFMNLLSLARGERPARRFCRCRPCLRMWAFRAAGILDLAVDLYAAHKFGAF